MYHRLGYEWAGSLLAFISLSCCSIPFLFFFKGEKIRRFSRFVNAGDEETHQAKRAEGNGLTQRLLGVEGLKVRTVRMSSASSQNIIEVGDGYSRGVVVFGIPNMELGKLEKK
jgi:hypothetical protein